MVNVHTFDDSGEAYDMTQCSDNIKTGDVLLVKERHWNYATRTERVDIIVALAWAWPIAVTVEHGHLHTIENDTGAYARVIEDAKFTIEQIQAALDMAERWSVPVRPLFAAYIESKGK